MTKQNHFNLGLAALLVSAVTVLATDPVWENNGVLTSPPQVDAVTFINNGTINFLSTALVPEPYETANTLNYTNRGIMSGSPGFRFNTAPSQTGVRKPAANFYNDLNAQISGTLYTLVSATNIINKGIFQVSASGEIFMEGDQVSLARSGLGVSPIAPTASVNGVPTESNFVASTAVYDSYWGYGTNQFDSSQIINAFGPTLYVISPVHQVTDGLFVGNTQLGLFDPTSSGYTNVVGFQSLMVTNMDGSTTNVLVPTNIVRQAAFVGVSNPTNFTTSIRFYPSSIATNPMQTVAVEVGVYNTNVITAAAQFSSLYFVDTLASETNANYLQNFDDGTFRPANYLLSRAPVIEYFFGDPGNADITEDFLYDPTFTNRVVTSLYSGYSAYVDNLTYRPPLVPGGTYTNLTGRVIVTAGSLDMNRARVRGEGYVNIQTDHLITSANANVDCENLNLDLASTNGLLRVQNLVKESVARMNGDVYAWSAIWTNSYTQMVTNYLVDTNSMETTLAPLTNVVGVTLHAMMFDATALQDSVPVTVHDLQMRAAENVIFDDTGTVISSFSLSNSPAFTLNGQLSLFGGITNVTAGNWTAQTAPSLNSFTNNGSLLIANDAHFGDDLPSPYLSFVNHGYLESYGQTIWADYCQLSGTNIIQASFNMNAQLGLVEHGRISAGGDITLQGDSIKLYRADVESGASGTGAGGRITFMATDSLSDAGAGSSNSLTCYNGIHLPVKPNTGDLLGTDVSSVSPAFALVEHTWAGSNLWATKEGYEDNAALGFLRLIPDSSLSDFEFQGAGPAGTTNGLYVDVLDLSQLPDYQTRLFIDQNLIIYFADSIGVPAEELNNQLEGRLRWVSEFAGPNSSVDVLVNGDQTVRYNRALRFSETIDSDGDGIPNGLDDTPFDGPMLSLTISAGTPSGVSLSWNASAKTVYQVQCKGSGPGADWHSVTWVTNTAPAPDVLTVVDTNATSACYYRVLYDPNGF